jgi:hypothetical protein
MGERVRPGNVRRFGTVWNSRVPPVRGCVPIQRRPRLASPGVVAHQHPRWRQSEASQRLFAGQCGSLQNLILERNAFRVVLQTQQPRRRGRWADSCRTSGRASYVSGPCRAASGPRSAVVGVLSGGAIEAWPIKARPGWLGPLGLAELMFLRSTPGRMGNLLIPSPHLATKSVCVGS